MSRLLSLDQHQLSDQQQCLPQSVRVAPTVSKASKHVGKLLLAYAAMRRKSNVTWDVMAGHALVVFGMASHVKSGPASRIRTLTSTIYLACTCC